MPVASKVVMAAGAFAKSIRRGQEGPDGGVGAYHMSTGCTGCSFQGSTGARPRDAPLLVLGGAGGHAAVHENRDTAGNPPAGPGWAG